MEKEKKEIIFIDLYQDRNEKRGRRIGKWRESRLVRYKEGKRCKRIKIKKSRRGTVDKSEYFVKLVKA